MCILSDTTLHERLHEFIKEPDHTMVNPASIDIRIGQTLQFEDDSIWNFGEHGPYTLVPKEFVLVATYEYIMVPLDCAVELKLKSSRARQGFDHSLAFWIDPGWSGVLTMEVTNNNRLKNLILEYSWRFAQIIVHKLDRPVAQPYSGRYQGATSVEAAKS